MLRIAMLVVALCSTVIAAAQDASLDAPARTAIRQVPFPFQDRGLVR